MNESIENQHAEWNQYQALYLLGEQTLKLRLVGDTLNTAINESRAREELVAQLEARVNELEQEIVILKASSVEE